MATQQQPFIEVLLLDSSSHEEDSPNKEEKQDIGLSGENISQSGVESRRQYKVESNVENELS